MNDQSNDTRPPSRSGILCRARTAVPAAAVAAVLTLGLGACGDDGSTAASTAESTAASTDLSAGDFILELEDEKQATIEQVVAANPECEGLTTDRDLLLYVTAKATDLKPDEPIEPAILDSCTP
jgi:hypothetical protein